MMYLLYGMLAVSSVLLLIWLADQLLLQTYLDKTTQPKWIAFSYQGLSYSLLLCMVLWLLSSHQAMSFDSNYLFLPILLAFAVVVVADKVFFHDRKKLGKNNERSLVNTAYSSLPILLLLISVRSFAFEPYNIPSSSMTPTLYTGDYILTNRFTYGIRLPIVNTKIMDIDSPKRGDVVVFRYPKNPSQKYIKRVIGVGGDTVSFSNGVLSVNDKPIATQFVDFSPNNELVKQIYPMGTQVQNHVLTREQAQAMGQNEELSASYQLETPSADHPHLTRHLAEQDWFYYADFLQQHSPQLLESQGQQWQIRVPKGQYFVMGDNRDRSADSRFWGFVPDENLVGKAEYVILHKEQGLHLPTFSTVGKVS